VEQLVLLVVTLVRLEVAQVQVLVQALVQQLAWVVEEVEEACKPNNIVDKATQLYLNCFLNRRKQHMSYNHPLDPR
jgi:hypothetical protein